MRSWGVLVALLFCLQLSVEGFVIVLEANEESCFFEQLSEGDQMGVTFEVGEGGRLDIDFRILTPGGRTLHELLRETANSYSFTAEETGSYTYCFDNKMSVRAQKTVTFSVVAHSQNSPVIQQGAPQDDEGSDLEKEVNELLAALKAVKDSQQYLRVRERAHRDTSESTNARIQGWSILQAGILFSLCVFQIFYLRNFFEVKQTV